MGVRPLSSFFLFGGSWSFPYSQFRQKVTNFSSNSQKSYFSAVSQKIAKLVGKIEPNWLTNR